MKRQFAFIACLATLLAWLPAHAQELKFATQNPKGHPLVMGMEKFAELVSAKSGGKIKINLFREACWAAIRPMSRRCKAERSTWWF